MEIIDHPVWCNYKIGVDGRYGCYSHHYLKTSPQFCKNCHLFNSAHLTQRAPDNLNAEANSLPLYHQFELDLPAKSG